MDTRLFLIPAGIFIIAIIVIVILNKRARKPGGMAPGVIDEFVREQLPNMREAHLNVVCALEDALNAQHMWVIAYNQDGMFFIPSVPNPFTRTLKRYEDLTPTFNLKKQIAANLLVGNKTENIDYVPTVAITRVILSAKKDKVKICVGDTIKSFKFSDRDFFGADQTEALNSFLGLLNSIK